MKRAWAGMAVLLACTVATGAPAAISREEYQARKERAEADYKAARQTCNPLKGNARDVCRVQAEGKLKVARAELEAQYHPSPRNDARVATERADAAYRLAREKCDDHPGNARDVCLEDAKAAFVNAKGDARARP
jgi:hypothetical protein